MSKIAAKNYKQCIILYNADAVNLYKLHFKTDYGNVMLR